MSNSSIQIYVSAYFSTAFKRDISLKWLKTNRKIGGEKKTEQNEK